MLKGSRKTKLEIFFIISTLFLISCFLVGFIKDFSGDQANIFFGKTADYMADYYNVAKYAATPNNPYRANDGECIIPPFAFMIFHYLSKCADFKNLTAFEAGKSNLGLISSSFSMLVISLLFFVSLSNGFKKKSL